MNAATAQTTADEPPLWSFASLADYQAPSAPGVSRARKRWSKFRQWFQLGGADTEQALKPADELRTFASASLDRLAAPPDWREAVEALDHALDQSLTAAPDGPRLRVLVTPPHAGGPAMLEHWAETHDARLYAPPTPEQILGDHSDWLDSLGGDQQPWVLPRLEHCYLRRVDGLDLIRTLLARIRDKQLGEGLIGCDSWAWAYLQHVWPMPDSITLAPQAFDGARLARFFSAAVQRGQPPEFRRADNGKQVLDPGCSDKESEAVSSTLHHIAEFCRGNPGAAWHHWRARLRTEPESGVEEDQASDCSTVWIAGAWQPPTVARDMDEDAALILHALLLHGGLHDAMLRQLLPLSPPRIDSLRQRLRDMGMIEQLDGRWQAAPLAYPSVRAFLQQRGYLMDGF